MTMYARKYKQRHRHVCESIGDERIYDSVTMASIGWPTCVPLLTSLTSIISPPSMSVTGRDSHGTTLPSSASRASTDETGLISRTVSACWRKICPRFLASPARASRREVENQIRVETIIGYGWDGTLRATRGSRGGEGSWGILAKSTVLNRFLVYIDP